MRLRLSIVMGLMLAVAVITGAQAPTLADRAAAIDRVLTQTEGYRVVVGHISRELSIVVDTLRAQHAQTGLSWGEILVAHRVAREAKVSFDQIAAEYRTGKSWEDLARDHKVDLQKITDEAQIIERGFRQFICILHAVRRIAPSRKPRRGCRPPG